MARRPKRIGRKDYSFRMRMDQDTKDKLNLIAESLDISKSDAVRIGINTVLETLWSPPKSEDPVEKGE